MNARGTAVTLRHTEGSPQVIDSYARPGQTIATAPKIVGLGHAILRRKKLLILTILLLNILAVIGIHQVTPRYTASSEVLVGPREEQVVDLKAVLAGLSGSSDVIENEIQVLRSRRIARGVVTKLHLDQSSEFNPSLERPGIVQSVKDDVQGAFTSLATAVASQAKAWGIPPLSFGSNAPTRNEAFDTDGLSPPDPLSEPVDRFLGQLDIAAKGRSRVVTISFTSTDPVLAGKVPNAMAEAYVADQLNAKVAATTQAHKWLDDRVAELRDQLLSADEAVESYRQRAGIVPIRDTTLLNQEVSEASQELMHAKEQLADVQAQRAAIVAISPNAFGLVHEVAAAIARVAQLTGNLQDLRKRVDVASHSEIGLRALQREADADRNLYDKLLARARETSIQIGLQQPDATIISRAERPIEASFPKPGIILPVYFIASCLVACLLALWLESLDSGFENLSQLEASLGIPAIGAIPFVKRARTRAKPENFGPDQPGSAFAEAIRNLHTSIILSGENEPPKTILFASALPGEGKSFLSLALARMVGSWGKRVVVVDCDLRNPGVHRAFNVPNEPGLTDCLSDGATLTDTLRCDSGSSVWFLTAGEGCARPTPLFASGSILFSSPAMKTLLQDLSRSFDLVLLDAGPVLGTSDTRHLCRLADRTVFAVKWQDTLCSGAALGLRQLADAGATIAGTVLTMVDPKSYRKFSPVHEYRRRPAIYLNP
jgi:polysaccharide biosynthesis transport protein